MLLAMVTYTHNDSALLNELLASLKRWSVLPAHIFIIDDASSPAYALPTQLQPLFGGSAALEAKEKAKAKQNLPGLDIIRPGRHLGPAQAKSFGIGLAFDAGADVVLSIDCDVRLPKHWLKESLQMLNQPQVGLIGSDPEHGLAGDVLSDYLREYEHVQRGIAETRFLGAGVWLLRQDVWREAGGLGGYNQYTHEDLYFSRLLNEKGFLLIAHNDPPAIQVRRLRASTHFNRQLRYLGFAILAVAKNKGVENSLTLIAEQASTRLEQAENLNKPAYAYLELLWLSSLLIYLAARGVMGNPAFACPAVTGEIRNLLAGLPNTFKLLASDLEAMHLVKNGFQTTVPASSNSDGQTTGKPDVEAAKTAHDLLTVLTKHPRLLSGLEAGEAEAIGRENSLFIYSKHYLEDCGSTA